MKKALISGILFSLILLVGCSGEPEVDVIDAPKNEGNKENLFSESETNLLSELKNEIMVSITEQTEFDMESIGAIMLGGNVEELSVSVGFPKDVKVDNTKIRQIVEDSIKKVSETENVTISEENITIKIEKY